MKELEKLAVGDIVEIEFKMEDHRFKWRPTIVGYVYSKPDTDYLQIGAENPLHSRDKFQYLDGAKYYPLSNMRSLAILKKKQ